jgi:hypothetical protein
MRHWLLLYRDIWVTKGMLSYVFQTIVGSFFLKLILTMDLTIFIQSGIDLIS